MGPSIPSLGRSWCRHLWIFVFSSASRWFWVFFPSDTTAPGTLQKSAYILCYSDLQTKWVWRALKALIGFQNACVQPRPEEGWSCACVLLPGNSISASFSVLWHCIKIIFIILSVVTRAMRQALCLPALCWKRGLLVISGRKSTSNRDTSTFFSPYTFLDAQDAPSSLHHFPGIHWVFTVPPLLYCHASVANI